MHAYSSILYCSSLCSHYGSLLFKFLAAGKLDKLGRCYTKSSDQDVGVPCCGPQSAQGGRVILLLAYAAEDQVKWRSFCMVL